MGPMMSYKITNDEIKWKKEPETETTKTNASTTASTPTMFDKRVGLEFNVEKMPNTPLIYNMANALKICHLRYENMKRMSNAQKEEMEIIHLGVISVIEMHCNDTGTRNDKTVKETFALIKERHLEALKEGATSIRMRLEEAKLQENKKKQMQIKRMNPVKRRRKAMMRKKWCIQNPITEKVTFLMRIMRMMRMMTMTKTTQLLKKQLQMLFLALLLQKQLLK
jgi:hypothetical protein